MVAVPCGGAGARLERARGDTLVDDRLVDHDLAVLEELRAAVALAPDECGVEYDVAAGFGVDVQIAGQRLLDVDESGQRFDVDVHRLSRVSRLLVSHSDHGHDGLANPADLVGRQQCALHARVERRCGRLER